MAVTLPHLTVSGTGSTEEGHSNCQLAALTAVGYGGPVPELPALTVSGEGVTGTVGSGSVSLPALIVSGADQRVSLPALTVSGAGVTGGRFGDAEVELPMLTVSGSGCQNQVGTATITLPVLALRGAGSTPLPAADATAGGAGADSGLELDPGIGLSMNLRISALTLYENFGFNSFATFNGVPLGANATGIFVIASGDLDHTAAIDATVRPGITDFEDHRQKRVTRAYVGYRTDGECVLRVSADEGEWYEYPLEDRDRDGIHATRVKLGRGAKGRYWQAEFANVAGSDFELDDMELAPEVLSRRIA
jgi:hypothetical protein